MKNLVGQRIRDARVRVELSQEQLMAQLQWLGVDIDQTALSRIENAERHITDIEIVALCKILKLDAGELFRGLRVPGVADFEVQTWTLLRPPKLGVRPSRITTKKRLECWS